jgi:hypothetical protein
MKKKLILILFLGVLYIFSFGQEVLLTREKYPEMRYLGMSGNIYFNEYQQIKGSAFLFDDWTKSDIVFKNGTIVKDVNLKIDVYMHQVVIYHDLLKRLIQLDKNEVVSFTFNDNGRERKFKKLDENKSKATATDGIFVEILVEGKVSVYKVFYKERIFMSTPVKPYIYEFSQGNEYRLNVDNNDIRISLGKKSLYKLFPEHKPELKEYIRKSHLKLKKEVDFAKAAEFINQFYK